MCCQQQGLNPSFVCRHLKLCRTLAAPPPSLAVIIEGMGRAIHTNYNAKFKCDALKLAMIKNRHLAQALFNGDVYDCVCRFDSTVPI